MSDVTTDLFNLSETTPEGSFAHGRALATGRASSSAQFRRGIDLSAEISFNGKLAGHAGKVFTAALDAAAQARAGVALQAYLPIDLFDPQDQAGLVARFRASAAASASIALQLGLSIEQLRALVADELEGPLVAIVDVLLAESRVSAGVWAKASFSAEAYGELIIAGSLLPGSQGSPGMSIAASYGAGWGGGAGYDFVTNLGFDDPGRLLDRLAEVTAEQVLLIADAQLEELPAAQAEAMRTARSLAALVLPVATRAMFRLGVELAAAQQSNKAAESIVKGFLAEAQQQLLRMLVDFGLQQVGERVGNFGAYDLTVGTTARAQLAPALRAAREALETLGGKPPSSVNGWLIGLKDCLAALDGLLALEMLPKPLTDEVQRAVDMAAAAGVLAHTVATAAHSVSSGSPFDAKAGELPPAAKARIAQAVGSTPQTLTLSDLVEFLVGIDPLEELMEAIPETRAPLEWVATVTGKPVDQVLVSLLVDLANPSQETATALLNTFGPALTDVVNGQIVTHLLDPLKAAEPDNEALHLFIDELVVPTLATLPGVVIPHLAQAGTEAGARRLREAISMSLLQLFGRCLVTTSDVLMRHGLQGARTAMRQLGDDIAEGTGAANELAKLTAAAHAAPLPLIPTPQDARDMLYLASDLVSALDKERAAIFAAAQQVLVLPPGNAAGAELAKIATTDVVPAGLDTLLTQVATSTWQVIGPVIEGLPDLIARYVTEQAQRLVEALEQGAAVVVQAALEAINWLDGQVGELLALAERLAEEINQLVVSIAASLEALAKHLRTLAGQVLAAIRDGGWALVEPHLPNWTKQDLRDLYDTLLDGVAWLTDVPLAVLEQVSGWVKDALEKGINTASYDEQTIRAAVRAAIVGSSASDVHIDLKLVAGPVTLFDAGRFTISASAITGAIADAVLADPIFTATIHAVAQANLTWQAKSAQEATVRDAHTQAVTQQQAKVEATALVPGLPLNVRFAGITNYAVVATRTPVKLHIDGATTTFVTPTLGVPARVTVTLNDRDYLIAPQAWEATDTALTAPLTFTLPPPEPVNDEPHETLRQTQTSDTPMVARVAQGHTITLERAAQPQAPRTPLRDDRPQLRRPAVTTRTLARVSGEDSRASSADTFASLELASLAGKKPSKVLASGLVLTKVLTVEPAVPPTPVTVGRDPTGNVALPGAPGLNVVQVAVADGQGRSASATLTFVLARAMTVAVTPSTVFMGEVAEITVTAKDAVTNEAVGSKNGRVFINNADVGPVGTPFRHRFPPGSGGPLVNTLLPFCEVRVSGYAPAPVPLKFKTGGDRIITLPDGPLRRPIQLPHIDRT